jgi:hypothetical protein
MKKIIYSIFAMLTLFITKVSLALDIQGELNNVTNPSDISSV